MEYTQLRSESVFHGFVVTRGRTQEFMELVLLADKADANTVRPVRGGKTMLFC